MEGTGGLSPEPQIRLPARILILGLRIRAADFNKSGSYGAAGHILRFCAHVSSPLFSGYVQNYVR